MEDLWQFLRNNPEFLPVFVWPVLTAIVNLGQRFLAARFPVLAALLRASGLDLIGMTKAFAAKKFPERTLVISGTAPPGVDVEVKAPYPPNEGQEIVVTQEEAKK